MASAQKGFAKKKKKKKTKKIPHCPQKLQCYYLLYTYLWKFCGKDEFKNESRAFLLSTELSSSKWISQLADTVQELLCVDWGKTKKLFLAINLDSHFIFWDEF